jgi:hypothetical protein
MCISTNTEEASGIWGEWFIPNLNAELVQDIRVGNELSELSEASLADGILRHSFGLLVHHHQPINVPTAEAQAFLMDYT